MFAELPVTVGKIVCSNLYNSSWATQQILCTGKNEILLRLIDISSVVFAFFFCMCRISFVYYLYHKHRSTKINNFQKKLSTFIVVVEHISIRLYSTDAAISLNISLMDITLRMVTMLRSNQAPRLAP